MKKLGFLIFIIVINSVFAVSSLAINLIVDYNNFQGISNLSYGVHDNDAHNFYLGNPDVLEKIKLFNFSFIRLQYKYYESCKYWNETTHSCNEYDWTKINKLIEAIKSAGAEPIICLGGGDIGSSTPSYWLPQGMTGNYSATGYPSDTEFGNYVNDIIKHMNKEKGYNVKYWEIWNEPTPCTKTDEFVHLFNNAQQRMHEADSAIKISNDRININPLADKMLSSAQGVGFLSFHHYAIGGTCMYPYNLTNTNNIFYPPNDKNGWNKDETIMQKVNNLGNNCPSCWCSYSPKKLVELWKQKIGKEFEIIATEINLNSAWKNGTDSRQQDIFGATWLASKVKAYILDGSETNLVYFNLMSSDSGSSKPMSKYGGFGFGMMNISYPFTNFAPAWSMYLLTNYIPKGSLIYNSSSSNSSALDLLTVKNKDSFNILLINKVNESLSFSISISGVNPESATLYLLDNTTYIQKYEPSVNKTIIYKSSISTTQLSPANHYDLNFNGYTVAILQLNSSSIIQLSLLPKRVLPNKPVTATISGLNNLDGKAVSVMKYISKACDCTVSGSGCSCTFISPSEIGTYTYTAYIDKNDDGDFTDPGENANDQLIVRIEGCPRCVILAIGPYLLEAEPSAIVAFAALFVILITAIIMLAKSFKFSKKKKKINLK